MVAISRDVLRRKGSEVKLPGQVDAMLVAGQVF